MARPKSDAVRDVSLTKTSDGWMEIVPPVAVSGIIIMVKLDGSRTYVHLTFRPDLMDATGWKLGDRLRVLIGVDWRSMKIAPDPNGYLISSSNPYYDSETDLVKSVQSKTAVRVPREVFEKIGPEKITLPLDKCEVSDGVLIVRWGGSDGEVE